MSEAPSSSSGQRFAQDLHRIREDRGVTLEELHEETKIPLGLLEQFEESGLFDHPMFNRVYLRSLVRTYARKVGLPIAQSLEMLDHALDGTYDGELAAEYFGESTARSSPDDAQVDASGGESAASDADNESEAAGAEAAEEVQSADEDAEDGPPSTTRSAPPMARTLEEQPESPGEPKPPPTPVSTPESNVRRQWLIGGGVVVVVLAAVAALLLLTGDGDESGANASAETPAPQDTVSTPVEETEPLDAPSLPRTDASVGDTLDVLVVAANEPVQGIRITRDEDVRRPYWIEQGEALAVPVRQRIVIEQGLDAIDLFVEGFDYPMEQDDGTLPDRIVITRSDAQDFIEQQSGAPSPPDVPTETLAIPSNSSP